MTFTAESTPELLKFFENLEAEDKASLFIPGNSFELIYEDKRIQYVALDPRQRPPKNGLFMPWIRVEDDLPPHELDEYLVKLRTGGPVYGGWEDNLDIATWGEVYYPDGTSDYDWTSIMMDWDGEVEVTHWMRIPKPPTEVKE